MLVTYNTDSVDITLSTIIKCYWLGNTSFFPRTLDKIRKQIGHRHVDIYALYNTPINVQPYRGVVDQIVEHLQLDASRIRLHTRDPYFQHPGVTKVSYHIWDEIFRGVTLAPHFRSIPRFGTDSDAKRFGALFGRIQLGRILLAHHLETQHPSDSYVNFMAGKDLLQNEIFAMEHDFPDITTWWNLRQNHKGTPTPNHHIGEYKQPYNLYTYPDVARLFNIEIVVETQYHTLGDFTEKTWRCLAFGKPFILLSGFGSMRLLKENGFQTFSPWIDESYDSIPDLMQRIHAIQKEIDRLGSLSEHEWNKTLNALNKISSTNADYYAVWQPVVNLP